jgi:MFS family permease
MAELSSEKLQANSDRWHAMGAGFLGWTLDAFDFFVVIFLLDTLAAHFRVPKRDIVLTITATLAMRPVGALLFGMMADRYGRRRPLMANVLFFSTIELLCGFAPSYTVFFILRMLFGIGMGASGASARHSPWNMLQCAGAACSRGFCRAGIPSVICWRPSPRGWCCPTGDGVPCSG